MAKFLTNYSLCPLVEEKTFVGVTEDKNPNHVIVTINDHLVARYSVSDAQQTGGWNTKGKITSAIAYHDGYVGVFNGRELRFWQDTDISIDKVKKYSFSDAIYDLIVASDNRLYIIFEHGAVSELQEAVDNRKERKVGPLKKEEKILEHGCVSYDSISYVTLLVGKPGFSKLLIKPVSPSSTHWDISLMIEDESKPLSHCPSGEKILVLRSNGCLNSLNPFAKNKEAETRLMSFEPRKRAVLKQLSSEYAVVYGGSDDGRESRLTIFDLKYASRCERTFQGHVKRPRLWTAKQTFFLVLGGYLVAVPYTLEIPKLSGLIGTMVNVTSTDILDESHLTTLVKDSNTDALLEALDKWLDVPDEALIDVLNAGLGNKKFNPVCRKIVRTHNLSDGNSLRRLNLDQALALLSLLEKMMKKGGEDEGKCAVWACALLDAFLHRCLLTNREDVVGKLRRFKEVVDEKITLLKDTRELSALAATIQRKNFPSLRPCIK